MGKYKAAERPFRRPLHKRHIDPARLQQPDHFRRPLHGHLHRCIRAAGRELPQEGRQSVIRDGDAGAQPQGGAALKRRRAFLQFAVQREQAAHFLEIERAGLGQTEAVGQPVKQPQPGFLLQLPHSTGNRGLGHVQRLGRPCDAARRTHRLEYPQMPDGHAFTFISFLL